MIVLKEKKSIDVFLMLTGGIGPYIGTVYNRGGPIGRTESKGRGNGAQHQNNLLIKLRSPSALGMKTGKNILGVKAVDSMNNETDGGLIQIEVIS